MSFRLFFLLLLLLPACSSGSPGTGVGDPGPGGPSGPSGPGTPAGPVTLPDGSTVPTVACGDESVTSASGTWDVVSSGGGTEQGAAVITITATSFVVASVGRTLSFSSTGGVMTLHWTVSSANPTAIAVTHAGAAVDTGLLSLPVGGQWTFKGASDESCSATLSSDAFNTTCSQVRSTPFGDLEGTVVGVRQVQHPSLFGELGGTWHLAGEGPASVDATFSGNTFTAVVTGYAGPLGRSGWVTVKVCNGAAAGKSSSGLELAATRQ